MLTVFVFHILVTHQTHRCLLISLTCQYLAFVKNLSVPLFVFVKSKIARLFHGFKVQIFPRAICVQKLIVHVIPTNKSVTLHVLYNYYSIEMHKTGVSYRGCVSMILGNVRSNTVTTGGILLPFGQNCSPSCNVNAKIPILLPGNALGIPYH